MSTASKRDPTECLTSKFEKKKGIFNPNVLISPAHKGIHINFN